MATEQQLHAVLGEFARTMATDFPIQGILDHLVLRIVDILPISASGVTLITETTKPEYVARPTLQRSASNSCRASWARVRVWQPTVRVKRWR